VRSLTSPIHLRKVASVDGSPSSPVEETGEDIPLSFLTLRLTFAVAFANSVETKQVPVKFSQQRPFHV
jgi:hypothetical protein